MDEEGREVTPGTVHKSDGAKRRDQSIRVAIRDCEPISESLSVIPSHYPSRYPSFRVTIRVTIRVSSRVQAGLARARAVARHTKRRRSILGTGLR